MLLGDAFDEAKRAAINDRLGKWYQVGWIDEELTRPDEPSFATGGKLANSPCAR